MADSLFPFTLPCCRDKGWSITEFRSIFLDHKPEGTWYGYDVIIKSATEIELVGYEMDDPVFGGTGQEVCRFTCNCAGSLTHEFIVTRAIKLAHIKRAKELKLVEDTKIAFYADEILREAGVM